MLFFAAALLFMHNVTPHVHAESQASHNQSSTGDEDTGLLDHLVNSFKLDFGEGHLECFSQAEGPSFSGISLVGQNPAFLLCPASDLKVIDLILQKEVIPKARDEILPSFPVCTGTPLRAPPVFA